MLHHTAYKIQEFPNGNLKLVGGQRIAETLYQSGSMPPIKAPLFVKYRPELQTSLLRSCAMPVEFPSKKLAHEIGNDLTLHHCYVLPPEWDYYWLNYFSMSMPYSDERPELQSDYELLRKQLAESNPVLSSIPISIVKQHVGHLIAGCTSQFHTQDILFHVTRRLDSDFDREEYKTKHIQPVLRKIETHGTMWQKLKQKTILTSIKFNFSPSPYTLQKISDYLDKQ